MSLKPATTFGLPRIDVPVEVGQDARAAPAALDGEDGLHRRVGEEAVDVGGAVLVPPGQVAVAVAHVRAEPGLEAEGPGHLLRDLDVDGVEVGRGRRHEADHVAGPQAPGLDGLRSRGRPEGAPRAGPAAPEASAAVPADFRKSRRSSPGRYFPPANEGSARLRIVCRPGGAVSTFGIVLTVIEGVATSPW